MEEKSTNLIKTTSRECKITESTKWYISEDKKDEDDEILCRVIHWDDAIPVDVCCGYYTAESSDEDDDKPAYYPGGIITYYIYDVSLYDKIVKYFNVNDSIPSAFIDSLDEPLEFKLTNRRRYAYEWYSKEGTIRVYNRWYFHKRLKDPGKEGKIDFYIDDYKNLFDKFVNFALKFNP